MQLHELKNTLASLRLRLGVVAADPTCRWAQEENLLAMQRIVEEAMDLARTMGESPSPARPTPKTAGKPRKAGKTGKTGKAGKAGKKR